MEDSNSRFEVAKVALISSLISVIIVFATLFIFRDFWLSFISVDIPTDVTAKEEPISEPVVEAVAKVNDAVVSVVVTKDVPVYERYYETYNPWGFFGGGFSIPRIRESGTEEREVGGGSGFIVSQDGMVITNHHVVADETARYSLLLNDGSVYKVEVLDTDAQLDIAVLKIAEPIDSPLTVAQFGDSNELRLGQTVIAIGNALAEFQNSVSVGVISGLSRSIVASDALGNTEYLDQVIQTDAAINPGNSGGPLLNNTGEVIGVNVATSRGADNIGFAIPAEVVVQVLDSVREYGEIARPFLGVRYTTINSRIAEANDLPVDYGALLATSEGEDAVLQDSPALKAGLQEGDIIVSINGRSLRDRDLSTVLRSVPIQKEVPIEIIRDGAYIEKRVTLIVTN